MPTKERQYRCSCVDASFDVNDLHDKTNIIGVGYNNMINFTIDDMDYRKLTTKDYF